MSKYLVWFFLGTYGDDGMVLPFIYNETVEIKSYNEDN
jgi:hypothetical protein